LVTVRIPLNHDKYALIDEEDLPLISGRNWHSHKGGHTWYAETAMSLPGGRQQTVKMHRLILGAPAGVLVDHRDRNGLNNTRENLRLATHHQNACNRKMQINNSSGFYGVSFDPNTGLWRAAVYANRHPIHLGSHQTAEEAARVRDAKAREIYSAEFLRLNFPDEESA
jgi:hypothetical protein